MQELARTVRGESVVAMHRHGKRTPTVDSARQD